MIFQRPLLLSINKNVLFGGARFVVRRDWNFAKSGMAAFFS
jgi:hypothetical protein